MKTLIYIEVLKEAELNFSNKYFQTLCKKFPDHTYFDLDNFSDTKTINSIELLLTESTECQLIINCTSSEAHLQKILSLFKTFKTHQSKITLQIDGEAHKQLDVLKKQLNRN